MYEKTNLTIRNIARISEFSYSGVYTKINESDGNWMVKFTNGNGSRSSIAGGIGIVIMRNHR